MTAEGETASAVRGSTPADEPKTRGRAAQESRMPVLKDKPTIPTQTAVVLFFPFDIELGPNPGEVIVRLTDDQTALALPLVSVDRSCFIGPHAEENHERAQRAATDAAVGEFMRSMIQTAVRQVPTKPMPPVTAVRASWEP